MNAGSGCVHGVHSTLLAEDAIRLDSCRRQAIAASTLFRSRWPRAVSGTGAFTGAGAAFQAGRAPPDAAGSLYVGADATSARTPGCRLARSPAARRIIASNMKHLLNLLAAVALLAIWFVPPWLVVLLSVAAGGLLARLG